MSIWTSFVKFWTIVSDCEFDANFLTFLGLYHLLFALETIELLNTISNIWEKTISQSFQLQMVEKFMVEMSSSF